MAKPASRPKLATVQTDTDEPIPESGAAPKAALGVIGTAPPDAPQPDVHPPEAHPAEAAGKPPEPGQPRATANPQGNPWAPLHPRRVWPD